MTKNKLNNSTAVLVLGICSLLTFWFWGLGAVLGIIGFFLARKWMNIFKLNPEAYTGYSQIKTGFILSIIGTILSLLDIIYMIILINKHGADFFVKIGEDVLK